MSEKKKNVIDETYDQFLKSADEALKDAEPDKEVKEEVVEKVEESLDSATANVEYDPVTGNVIATGETVKEENFDEKLDKIWNSIKVNNQVDEATIGDLLKEFDITDLDAITGLATVIKDCINGNRPANPYNKLPQALKNLIDKNISEAGQAPSRQTRNMVANGFLNSILQSYSDKTLDVDLEELVNTINKGQDQLKDDEDKEFANQVSDIFVTADKERREAYQAAIERCKEKGDEVAVQKFQDILDSMDSAYDLKDFLEFCKTVKIKKFDLEKPEKIFNDFNWKYENHRYVINNIATCPAILDRHILNLSNNGNLKLCLAFCKYCQNMKPDNMKEHTFMYYFIRNIIAIDRMNPKGTNYESMSEEYKAFYDGFVKNLVDCITSIK